ncbi:hypothetical protein C5Y96_05630 [Blastopirellula marina]|uniref:Uncharacterized protein n=1 Tax=Blastopirellula marina TaxID=124 RepID=A0A2S8G5A8_9BACT|nr:MULTISPECIES: hypothetical protein [Pirellulaceae]PQO39334.1 hypothetical protein C5Y96_05630 [Blastopirellula marina]RCS55642.1 hypothetical protein DTL36_05640 [Bremerella cremea]
MFSKPRRLSVWPSFWLYFITGAALCFLLHSCHAAMGDELGQCRRLAPKYNATLEARQWDGTRVDLLTDTHAIEADWAYKWAEAIGQAAYYAELTGKKPGVLILVKDAKEEARYIYRAQTVCARLGFTLFVEIVQPLPDETDHAAAADRRRDEQPAIVPANPALQARLPHPRHGLDPDYDRMMDEAARAFWPSVIARPDKKGF